MTARSGHPEAHDGTVRILAVTRKPESSSFDQRVVRFIEPLRRRGIEVKCAHFESSRGAKREVINQMRSADAVWWHRHLVHPLWIRRWRGSARCIGYDFDDPVCFSPRRPDGISRVRAFKFRTIVSRSDVVLAGSAFLQDLASPFCSNVTIVPMAVDLNRESLAPAGRGRGTELLWLGSAATQPYLELIRGALQRLGESRSDISLRLVAHAPMSFGSLPVSFRQWSLEEEAAALRECAVGLCPMPDSPWTRGKCPYKVLQYMASAMPWVGSAVGENIMMAAGSAAGGDTGSCATSSGDWIDKIRELIDDPVRRAAMGQRGARYVLAIHEREHVADLIATIWHDALAAAAARVQPR